MKSAGLIPNKVHTIWGEIWSVCSIKKGLIYMDKGRYTIPCYNSGKVLDRAVSSVQNQTWKNCEE